jgi:acetyl esterase/lipase
MAAREEAMQRFASAFPDLHDSGGVTIEDLRERDDALWMSFLAPDALIERVTAGGIPSLWVRVPGSRVDRAVVWFHGGGNTIGSARGRSAIAAEISRAGDCRVLVPDFRLAPEDPFPAGVEDCLGATTWAVDLLGAE